MTFQGLITHLFSEFNNNSLSGGTTVLLIRVLKDVLVALKFSQL